MPARRTGLLLSAALTATTAGALAVAPTATAAGCGSVVSATKNGAPLDASWIQTNCFGAGGSRNVSWSVWTGPWADGESGANLDLGSTALADTYVITLDTGTTIPRVTDTKGGNVMVARTKQGDGHWHVAITAKPVLATGECNQSATPWTCPAVATKQWDGYLGGTITDYGTWDDEAQRNAFFGMDYSSNIDAGAIPPQIVRDPGSGRT